jgi:hypothetical protein
MAAGLGFIEFTTGDVLTAADANGYLASQVVMVFADAADRTADLTSPEEGMISYLKDTNAVEKYDGAAWVAVGGGAAPKVLQIVSAATATKTSTTSASYVDVTNLTATITPSSATSKILVMVNNSIDYRGALKGPSMKEQIVRDATAIYDYENIFSFGDAWTGSNAFSQIVSLIYVDSPATTAATTYKVQICRGASGTTATVNDSATDEATITLMEITV